MEVDIQKYNMEEVTMTEHPDNRHLLLLKVKGFNMHGREALLFFFKIKVR